MHKKQEEEKQRKINIEMCWKRKRCIRKKRNVHWEVRITTKL
jgi:hypothetical protein